MEISGISSLLGMQQDVAKASAQTTGEDFKDLLAKAAENNDDTELKEACDQLESYMLSMVFKQMKESMLQDDENALIPKGDYTSTFEEMMINNMADKMVEAGGIGLSDQLYKQMKNSYGVQMDISNENQAAALSAATKVSDEA